MRDWHLTNVFKHCMLVISSDSAVLQEIARALVRDCGWKQEKIVSVKLMLTVVGIFIGHIFNCQLTTSLLCKNCKICIVQGKSELYFIVVFIFLCKDSLRPEKYFKGSSSKIAHAPNRQ